MRTSQQIQAEITERLGYIPPYFLPALSTPETLASLWQLMTSAYLDNPLPTLLKEKLFTYLSRYCSVPYYLVCQSCRLYELGMAPRDILQLITTPPIAALLPHNPLANLPSEPDSPRSCALERVGSEPVTDHLVWHCAVFMFLQPDQAEAYRTYLQQQLGQECYLNLSLLLGYIKFCHHWSVAHPEASWEDDRRVIAYLSSMIEAEPFLATFFQTYYQQPSKIALGMEQLPLATQARQDAWYDSITGLPNQALFIEHLQQALRRVKTRASPGFVLCHLDFDRFHVVKYGFGHRIGNQLLAAAAHRLVVNLPTDWIIARVGEDEFTILLEQIPETQAAMQVARVIQSTLSTPFNLEGHEIFVTASIGIVLSSISYERAEDFLRAADTATHAAKQSGMAGQVMFDLGMQIQALQHLQMDTDLRRAIERNEFQVYYQPIVSLQNQIIGLEALLRWNHPQRGLVFPGEFIPLAEETRLITALGIWVLREACHQLQRWQQKFAPASLSVSVNLSAIQLDQPDFAEQVEQIIRETGLQPDHLKLEITESALVANADRVQQTLRQLKDQGIRLCIDDFGVGYSSLSYLHTFPFDILKIDRSFVSSAQQSQKNLEIIRTILLLAHSIGMDVIAEGIETSEQLMQLRSLNCPYGQGHFFSEAIDSLAFEQLLEQSCFQDGTNLKFLINRDGT